MERKPKLNVRLLNRVLRHIKAEPRRLNMNMFGVAVSKEETPCGMQACLGGWSYFLSLSRPTPKKWREAVETLSQDDIAELGQAALGLTDEEASSLFWTKLEDNSYETAKAKIDLLKKDRERFVEEYPY